MSSLTLPKQRMIPIRLLSCWESPRGPQVPLHSSVSVSLAAGGTALAQDLPHPRGSSHSWQLQRAQKVKPQTWNRFYPVSPDIGRVGPSQEECRTRKWLLEHRKVHDICQVPGNSLQVHPPHVAALHLHQVGEEELSQLRELPWKVIMHSSVRATKQDVLAPSILPISHGISYLDYGLQLVICQLACCRAGQPCWDLHLLHGRDVGREFGHGGG